MKRTTGSKTQRGNQGDTPTPRAPPAAKVQMALPRLCSCGSAFFRVRHDGSNYCAACLEDAA